MRICTICKEEIQDEDVCYYLVIIRGTGKEPQDGVVVNSEDLCEDCYSNEFF